jgi:hypothetical protein
MIVLIKNNANKTISEFAIHWQNGRSKFPVSCQKTCLGLANRLKLLRLS